MSEVVSWLRHWLGGVGVLHHGVTLILTFDLVIVTMSFKMLSGLFLGFHKV